MSTLVCDQIQSSFSAYLDGAVSGHEMQEIARHLEGSTDPTTRRSHPALPDVRARVRRLASAQDALALCGRQSRPQTSASSSGSPSRGNAPAATTA